MSDNITIIIVDDDAGHVRLIERNLARAGRRILTCCFQNGQEVLDFLHCRGSPPHVPSNNHYLLLLDIRMPQVDGVEVLRQIKDDPALRKIPVIMFTTADDPREIERCYLLGCNSYLVKPVDYDSFSNAVLKLGTYLSVVRVP